MSAVIITGDAKFGPWVIPYRAQNAVSNAYATTNGIIVDTFIPEPIFSNQFLTTIWIHEYSSLHVLFFCSILQLPVDESYARRLSSTLANIQIHFALEGEAGCGEKFLLDACKEATLFKTAHSRSDENITSLFDLYKHHP